MIYSLIYILKLRCHPQAKNKKTTPAKKDAKVSSKPSTSPSEEEESDQDDPDEVIHLQVTYFNLDVRW